jgi:hypothetical protein
MGQKRGYNSVESIENASSDNKKSDFNLEIPVSIFQDRSLSVFEILVEYLKENFNHNYHDIAVLTNRDERTIWTVYSRVQKKRESRPKTQTISTEIFVPISVLLDRRCAVLEAIVFYLREKRGFSFHEIGGMLGRNDRTVWTVYSRAKKKLNAGKEDNETKVR